MKNGSWELLKKFIKDSVVGFLIVAAVAIPAIVINIFLHFYEASSYADDTLIIGLRLLEMIIFLTSFAIAVTIVVRLAWELIKEIWN